MAPEDVVWVGASSGEFALSWAEFAPLADQDYDAGYGFCEVATDLVVVGDGWWIQRYCYAGKEWWQFHSPPTLGAGKPFSRVFIDLADRTLAETKLATLNREQP